LSVASILPATAQQRKRDERVVRPARRDRRAAARELGSRRDRGPRRRARLTPAARHARSAEAEQRDRRATGADQDILQSGVAAGGHVAAAGPDGHGLRRRGDGGHDEPTASMSKGLAAAGPAKPSARAAVTRPATRRLMKVLRVIVSPLDSIGSPVGSDLVW
jgi:hypothetical protein